MLRGAYLAAAGLQYDQWLLSGLGHDVANLNTPGYRRSEMPAQEFTQLLYNAAGEPVRSLPIGTASWGPYVTRQFLSTDQGAMRATGRSLDVALDGPGWLAVREQDGSTAYIRSGALQVDAAGHLALPGGQLLVGDQGAVLSVADASAHALSGTADAGGDAVAVAGESSELSIDPTGAVHRGERVLGRLLIAAGDQPMQPNAAGDGTYVAATGTLLPQADPAPIVRTGMLEMGNVDLARTMVDMIRANRAYQFAATALRTQDELLGMAADRLAGA